MDKKDKKQVAEFIEKILTEGVSFIMAAEPHETPRPLLILNSNFEELKEEFIK